MDWILVGVAGFLGGMLNALAGGGSFLTLPALIFAGVPPVAANATGTAALLPGYIASAWRFRKDIEIPAGLGYMSITLISTVGGSLGAGILLVASESVFSVLIPWLILFATIAFIVSPRFIREKLRDESKTNDWKVSRIEVLKTSLILLIICVYGGYFNGGLGIIILAALGIMGQTNLLGMNGLKNFMSVILTVVAVIIYALGGTISVKYLLVLGSGSVLGGYAGASVAYRLSPKHLRYFVVAVGCLMSVAFFIKNN